MYSDLILKIQIAERGLESVSHTQFLKMHQKRDPLVEGPYIYVCNLYIYIYIERERDDQDGTSLCSTLLTFSLGLAVQ